jgi:Low-density lipoprotein receptor domain class A.
LEYQLPDYFDLYLFYFSASHHDISPEECKQEQNLFLCANNVECIEIGELCDGVKHCHDGSDEGVACNASKWYILRDLSNYFLIEEVLTQSFIVGIAACQSAGCSHRCVASPNGPLCICQVGYEIVNNNTCVGMYRHIS